MLHLLQLRQIHSPYELELSSMLLVVSAVVDIVVITATEGSAVTLLVATIYDSSLISST